MRRRKNRSAFSFRDIKINETTTLWICIFYLFFVAICTCNDVVMSTVPISGMLSTSITTEHTNSASSLSVGISTSSSFNSNNRSSRSSRISGDNIRRSSSRSNGSSVRSSTISMSHESTTPIYSSTLFINNSKDVTKLNDLNVLSNYSEINNQKTQQQREQRRYTFLRSGNELWDGLIDDCLQKPTFSCFQKNVYLYLDNTLKLDDVNVTDRILFKKIDIDVNNLYQLQNNRSDDNAKKNDVEADGDDDDDDDDDTNGTGRSSDSPLEEVTDSLYGKFRNFMMTHNLELKLPDMFFDGATFKISPRSIEGDGALVKLEFIPKDLADTIGSGRIFLKKIKKFFKHKLLLSFLAIILIIKLIKIKIFWILPLIVGVTAAKKLLLKFLLFLFPALTHLFKLCSFYHKTYHDTKYHHHKHQINHLHTIVPAWYKEHQDHHIHGHGPEIIYSAPPRGHPVEYVHGLPHPSAPYWDAGKPHHHSGPDFIPDIHRNIHVNNFKPKLDDMDTINSWGLTEQQNTKSAYDNLNPYIKEPQATAYSSPEVENSISRTPIHNPNPSSSTYNTNNYGTSSQMKYTDNYLVAEKLQNLLQQQTSYAQVQNAGVNQIGVADPFYGPIVAKIDNILTQFGGYLNDNCKEWLVCNMYKTPEKFSPYSNFLSAELSRDSSELEKPTSLNSAVLTFYKYVKAARDGQDQKDCLAVNPKCVI